LPVSVSTGILSAVRFVFGLGCVDVSGMEFVPLLVIAALVKKALDTLKFLTNQDWNAVLTQVVAWAVGVAAVFAVAHSDFGSDLVVAGHALAGLNGWSLSLVGAQIASAASLAWDTLKAVDNHNTAATPPLTGLPPARTAPVLPAK
jgi:hypothetical protein